MDENQVMQIKFSNGSIFQIPVSAIINHYTENVVQKAFRKPLEEARNEAREYFTRRPDQIIEYASNCMSYIDIILVADEVNALTIADKNNEWCKAEKLLIKIEAE